MKNIIAILVLGSTLAAQAANNSSANFSAFINNNVLYTTVLGDSCNHVGGHLKVAGLCNKDRLTRNFVVECDAELEVMQTEMACGDVESKPKALAIKLSETQVDPNAKYLRLKYYDEVARLKINKSESSEMSAFTRDNKLYLTLLGDCNAMNAGLQVDGLCHEDRLMQNYVDSCEADVMAMETKRACPAMSAQPKTFVIDLAKARVAKEAKELHLKYSGKVLKVQINK